VGEDVERPELVEALDERVDGDVRFDTYTRQMYATDASAYEVTPIGVVFPTGTADVASVVSYCAEREIPVLPAAAARVSPARRSTRRSSSTSCGT